MEKGGRRWEEKYEKGAAEEVRATSRRKVGEIRDVVWGKEEELHVQYGKVRVVPKIERILVSRHHSM